MPLVQRRGIVQNPKHLDKVCAFFPELVIVSAHGGAPWTGLLVQLLRTWPNLHHMISAYPPSRYPPELVAFANTRRGRMKMMYASDYPLLTFDRVRRELPDCGISEDVMPWFTGEERGEGLLGRGRRHCGGGGVTPLTTALGGLRICDFSGQLAGAGATRFLAAMGAEVIRIEDPVTQGYWDVLRGVAPFVDERRGPDFGGPFNNHNVEKLGVTLNLRTDDREGTSAASWSPSRTW